MNSMDIELVAAIAFWAVIIPTFYVFKKYQKLSKRLIEAEKEIQRLRLLYQQPSKEVVSLRSKLESSEKSADLLGAIIKQYDEKISQLTKENQLLSRKNDSLSTSRSNLQKEILNKSKAENVEKSASKGSNEKSRRQQSPAVRSLLERLLEKETGKNTPKPKSRIPSVLDVNTDPVEKETREKYDPSVWEMRDGKLTLKDMSAETEQRRRESVSGSHVPLRHRTDIANSLVVHSDPRD